MTTEAQTIDETMFSVCYRTGTLIIKDYDEAIQDLEKAKVDLRWKREGYGIPTCFVCEDGGHTAAGCHHNPLLLARAWARATEVWQCWHCGFVATNDEEASDHFGKSDDEVAKCLTSKAVEAAVAAERERCAKIADLAFEGRERHQSEAMKNGDKRAERDFQSMKFQAVEIAAAIRREA